MGRSWVHNSLITKNIGGFGGGVYCDSSDITSCTISDNRSDYTRGGGIHCMGSPYIVKSIIYFNTNVFGESNYDNEGIIGYPSYFSCCTAPASSEIEFFPSNIWDDPLFVDRANGDYRLQTNSPCINWGVDYSYWDVDTD